MGTSSLMHIVRKRKKLSASKMLSGLLLALPFLLPSVALARSAHDAGYMFGTSQALDRASVSVVRLVATYTTVNGGETQQCRGLGVLVSSSSSASATGGNAASSVANWVLTDGALLNPTTPSCLGPTTAGHPVVLFTTETLNLYASSAYTATAGFSPNTSLLNPTSVGVSVATVKCQKTCGSGLELLTFVTTDLQPFVDASSTGSPSDQQQMGVELTDGTTSVPASSVGTPKASPTTSPTLTPKASPTTSPTLTPTPSVTVTGNTGTSGTTNDATQFLTPIAVPAPSSGTPAEAGMPIVNSNGLLVGMHLTSETLFLNASTVNFVNSTINTSSRVANQLHTGWNNGVDDFYATPPRYAEAQQALQQIATLNPNFQAGSAFKSVVATKLSPAPSKPPRGGNSAPTISIFGFSIPRSWLIIAGIVLALLILVVIFFLVSVVFGGQNRAERARFNAEKAEADRIAELEVQQRRQRASATAAGGNRAIDQRPITAELHCPNCGHAVSRNDNFCPACRYMLSPSASGLHLDATLTPSQAATPQAVPEPPLQMSYVQPPRDGYAPSVGMAASSMSISDMPTLDILPEIPDEQMDQTAELAHVQRDGRNVSFVVGYHSDVGLKRKHKPNEDNLLAVQGPKGQNAEQQFGLFVVADGMGGHANGQDASRLAIQTIINDILPKIPNTSLEDDAALQRLLVDGVQAANQAVYEHNMQTHADTGTTMTAALVVGATAYVANVGDSRTYLYREPVGLTKITRDHSIVASLVDAGIIQPDDVYTHPKRNQIYRSLGEKPGVEVDSFPVKLKPGDKLLLCSDGLWEMVRDPDIARLLSEPLPDPANALVQAALKGGGEDNVSVIVVHITEAENRPAMTGIQLLTKPDAVTVPDMPPM